MRIVLLAFYPRNFGTGDSSYAGFGQFVPLPLIGTSGIMSDLSVYFHPSRLFTYQTLLVPPLADWQPHPPLHPASQSLVPHQNLYLLHQRSCLISTDSHGNQLYSQVNSFVHRMGSEWIIALPIRLVRH